MTFLLLSIFTISFLAANLEGDNVRESGAVEMFRDYGKVMQLYKDHNKRTKLHYDLNKDHSDEIKKSKLDCFPTIVDSECTVIIKWDKYVPYELDKNMSGNLTKNVRKAITQWNSLFGNCIKLIERKSEEDYVTFMEAPMCYASVGKRTGEQFIGLHKNDCKSFEKIAHEIMHTIGIRHEHMRPDRDNYIQILFADVPPDLVSEYMKYEDFFFKEFQNMPYDYYSLTHYPVLGPDKKTEVMKILKDNVDASLVGSSSLLSTCDFVKIKTLYCKSQITSENEYVKNCNSYTKEYITDT